MQFETPVKSGGPSRLFILRPIATTLFMVAIFLAGIIGYRFLPVSALPQVDYPTIQVVTLYPGASPDVMTSAITAPLERQLGQMSGLKQMFSQSAGGSSVITLTFQLSLALDIASRKYKQPLMQRVTYYRKICPILPYIAKLIRPIRPF